MIHVRHAAAAIASGLCETVLITHGESGRSGVGRTRNVVAPTSLAGQFEQPYGPMGPPTLFTIPVLRYMKTYGLSHEQFAMVDGGGALILVAADRRRRLPAKLAPGSEQGAGLPPRHRRERRDADGQPNGGFHLLARLPHHRRQGLCRGPHYAPGILLYGLPRRAQRTLSRINIKMAVELSAEKSA
jgi:hypothetical protein